VRELKTGEMWDPEFRRSIWKGLVPMVLGLVVAGLAMMGDNLVMSVFGAITFLGGCWELFLAIRDPLLVITPGIITHRLGRFGRASEIPKPDVESWNVEHGAIVIRVKGGKPVKIKLAVLRKKDQSRVAEMLASFGYPLLEESSAV
jgi:hypothetical protein